MNDQLPVPHDIPLPLPAPEPLLVVLLVLSFLMHILFVNLMVGGALLTFFFELIGLRRKGYDRLAYFIAETVTVNKSLAVVLGVAPLLLLNVLYTVYFYTANALTGTAWIMVIPLVTMAFLLLYLHKYCWKSLAGHKALHLAILGAAIGIFLLIPLVFLANINLMLFPNRWPDIRGFMSALLLPNVLPRYLHFLAACLAVASLFLVAYFSRAKFQFQRKIGLPLSLVQKQLYTVALAVTGAQFVIGPLVYATMPSHGISLRMNGVLLLGIVAALPAMYWMWREIADEDGLRGRYLKHICVALSLTVLMMATGRHLYREKALAPHKAQMAAKTERFLEASAAARERASQTVLAEVEGGGALAEMDGERLYRTYCAACHALDTRLVGPPLKEIQPIYLGDPEGIVSWAKAPGRKREDYPPMPPMNLPNAELQAIAAFMLQAAD